MYHIIRFYISRQTNHQQQKIYQKHEKNIIFLIEKGDFFMCCTLNICQCATGKASLYSHTFSFWFKL